MKQSNEIENNKMKLKIKKLKNIISIKPYQYKMKQNHIYFFFLRNYEKQ